MTLLLMLSRIGASYDKSLANRLEGENMNFTDTVNELFKNQKNYLYSRPVEKDWEDSWKYAPTRYLTENLEPLVKKTEYKTYKKNGKPYLVECVICLYEKDMENKIMADYRFGYAKVHPCDVFNEKVGRELAYKRALTNDDEIDGLTGKLYDEVDKFNSTFKWDMEPTPMVMLELVKSCMPTIVRSKLFEEYAVETDKDNITWLKK